MENTDFESWAILELMGHRKLAGMVKTESLGGAPFIRIDIYSSESKIELTQYYNPSSIYSITPTFMEVCIKFTKNNYQQPVQRWELPEPVPSQEKEIEDDIPV